MRIDPERDVLGVIDVQPTFMPGGELPVADGEAVVPLVNRLLRGPFRHAFATQDWHPAGHVSFASAHGRAPYDVMGMPYGPQVLWPDHAIQGTPGAALHPDLDAARIEAVVRKGFHPATDSYSAFFENDRVTRTGLHGWLLERGFRRLFLVGLATDFCVAWSAEDAARLGLRTVVVEDATRAIALPAPQGGSTLDAAHARWRAAGIATTSVAELESRT